MIRQASAFVIVLCLSSVSALAQLAPVTVTVASVEIRKGPSIVNPVIGQARQGTVLEITRDVGDWYEVRWPDADGGRAFVRKSTLRTAGPVAGARTAAAPTSSAGVSPVLPSRAVGTPQAQQRPASVRPAPVPTYATPSHALGIGALAGGPMAASEIGFGVSARAWSERSIGVQVEGARYTLTSALSTDHVTAMHVAPSALIAMPGYLNDNIWFRPYAGVGAHMSRLTLNSITGVQTTVRQFGMQTFGGAELTLASMPRLALSADAGYRWMRESFTGFDSSGLGVTIGVHWYIR